MNVTPARLGGATLAVGTLLTLAAAGTMPSPDRVDQPGPDALVRVPVPVSPGRVDRLEGLDGIGLGASLLGSLAGSAASIALEGHRAMAARLGAVAAGAVGTASLALAVRLALDT